MSGQKHDTGRNTTHLTLLSHVHHPPSIKNVNQGLISASADEQYSAGMINSSIETVDRITRYAQPNRYDTLNAPTSFLDSRRSRSQSKCQRAAGSSSDSRLTQSYHTSFSAVTQPTAMTRQQQQPQSTVHLSASCSHDGALESHSNCTTSSLSSSSSSADRQQRLTQMQEYVRNMLKERELEKKQDMLERHNREVGNLALIHSSGPLPTLNGISHKEKEDDVDNHHMITLSTFERVNSATEQASHEEKINGSTSCSTEECRSRTTIRQSDTTHNRKLHYQCSSLSSSVVVPTTTAAATTNHANASLLSEDTRLPPVDLSNSVSMPIGTCHSVEQLSINSSGASTSARAASCSLTSGRTGGRSSLLSSLLRRFSPRHKRRTKSASPGRFLDDSDESTTPNKDNEHEQQRATSSKKGASFLKLFKSSHLSKRHRRDAVEAVETTSAETPSSNDAPCLEANVPITVLDNHDSTRFNAENASSANISASNSNMSTKILHSLELDRVPDPYSSFKAVQRDRQNATKDLLNEVNNGCHDNLNGCGKIVASSQTHTPLLTGAPALRPVHLSINRVSIQGVSKSCTSTPLKRDVSGGLTPSYLNLSINAFGYDSYYKHEISTQHQLPLSQSRSEENGLYGKRGSGFSSVVSTPLLLKNKDTAAVLINGSLRVHEPSAGVDVVADAEATTQNKISDEANCVSQRLSPSDGESHSTCSSYQCHTLPSINTKREQALTTPDGDENYEENIVLRQRKTKSVSEDSEMRHRSSLIMMNVAHHSPRGKLDLERSTSLRLSGYLPPCGGSMTPTIENAPDFDHCKMLISGPSATGLTGGVLEKPSLMICMEQPPSSVPEERSDVEKDGAYFLDIVDQEENIIRIAIAAAERDLESRLDIGEEAAGMLRAAAGKGRLLIKEKLAQFRGLCNNNLHSLPDAAYATRTSDLAGFWAMCELQLDDLRRAFVEVQLLRDDDFVIKSVPITTSLGAPRLAGKSARKRAVCANSASAAAANDNAQRAEARKRLLAAKREAMRRQQQSQCSPQPSKPDLVIFA